MTSQKKARADSAKSQKSRSSFPWKVMALTAGAVFLVTLIVGGSVLAIQKPDLFAKLSAPTDRELAGPEPIKPDAPIQSVSLTAFDDRLKRLELERQRLENDLTRSENRIEIAKQGISDSIKALEQAQKDQKKQASPQKGRNKKLDKAMRDEQKVRKKLVAAIEKTEEIISLLTEARRRLSTAGSSRQAAIEMALLAKADAFNSRNNAAAQKQAQRRVAYAQKKLHSLNSFASDPQGYIRNLEADLLKSKEQIYQYEADLKKARKKAGDVMRATGNRRHALKDAQNRYRSALNNKADFERNLESETETLAWKEQQLKSVQENIKNTEIEKSDFLAAEKQKRHQAYQAYQNRLAAARAKLKKEAAPKTEIAAISPPLQQHKPSILARPSTTSTIIAGKNKNAPAQKLAPAIETATPLAQQQIANTASLPAKQPAIAPVRQAAIVASAQPPLPPKQENRLPTGALQSKKSIILSPDPKQLPRPLAPAVGSHSMDQIVIAANSTPPIAPGSTTPGPVAPVIAPAKVAPQASTTASRPQITPQKRPVRRQNMQAQSMRQIDLDSDIPDTVPTIEPNPQNKPKIPAPRVTIPSKQPVIAQQSVSKTASKAQTASAQPSPWALQVGAFSDKNNATKTMSFLKKQGFDAFIKKRQNQSGTIYMVRVQGFSDRRSAKAVVPKLKRLAKLDSVVVRN